MEKQAASTQRWHEMLLTILTTICALGIGFYIQFMVALWRECRPRASGYWIRLRLNSQTGSVVAMQSRRREAYVRRAA